MVLAVLLACPAAAVTSFCTFNAVHAESVCARTLLAPVVKAPTCALTGLLAGPLAAVRVESCVLPGVTYMRTPTFWLVIPGQVMVMGMAAPPAVYMGGTVMVQAPAVWATLWPCWTTCSVIMHRGAPPGRAETVAVKMRAAERTVWKCIGVMLNETKMICCGRD
ncbi:hypothetical protein BC830DRAFT_1142302 [Chytriomyces sp. MP71]|nr:hypothetical protein BC830DRAFT_1142302 [Chytriomyces sp. MP71]